MKTLVLPEWWMLAGLPVAFLLVAIDSFPHAPARQFADRPARGRCFGFVAQGDGLAGTGQ